MVMVQFHGHLCDNIGLVSLIVLCWELRVLYHYTVHLVSLGNPIT